MLESIRSLSDKGQKKKLPVNGTGASACDGDAYLDYFGLVSKTLSTSLWQRAIM